MAAKGSTSAAPHAAQNTPVEGFTAPRGYLRWALLPGVLLALAAGGIALSRGFDGLYGQDAYAYFDYSTASVRQSLLHLQPLEPFFWPPGYPVLVAITSLAVGQQPLAGQLVSLLMGALVPILIILLVRELFPTEQALALLAGAIAAVSGQLWQSSVVVMADTTGLALATFSAWALVRYASGGKGAWLVAASAALAYATLARWIYGIVAVPFAAYALLALIQRRSQRAHTLITALLALGVAVLILGPVVGPPLLGLVSHPEQPAAFAGNFQVYSWSPLNALRHDFFTADGHLEYALPNGVYYAIAPANLAFFGPLLAIWAVVGLLAARAWPRPTSLLVIGWVAAVLLFHAGAPWQNFRFTLAYLPPLAILSAAGLLLAWRSLRHPIRLLVPACAIVGLLIASASAVRLVERFIDTKDQELALVHWVQAQAPPDAQLLTFGPTLAFRHYSSLPTFDLFDVSTTDMQTILSTPAPHYLLVDESSVEEQWLNQPPSTNFLYLRDGPGLQPLGAQGSYTLYRITPAP
jgi:4-amino-4-deoxy-L-arabinose transferase-like glycosyltransferase